MSYPNGSLIFRVNGSSDSSDESTIDEQAGSRKLNNPSGSDNNSENKPAFEDLSSFLVNNWVDTTSSGPILNTQEPPEQRICMYISPGMTESEVLEPRINLAPKRSVRPDGSDLYQDIPRTMFFYNLGVGMHQALITNQEAPLPFTVVNPPTYQTYQPQPPNPIPQESDGEDISKLVKKLLNGVVQDGTRISRRNTNGRNPHHGGSCVAVGSNVHQSNVGPVYMNSQYNSQAASTLQIDAPEFIPQQSISSSADVKRCVAVGRNVRQSNAGPVYMNSQYNSRAASTLRIDAPEFIPHH